jgi:hypothetical protein
MHALSSGIATLSPGAKKLLEDWRHANVPLLMADASCRKTVEALGSRIAEPDDSAIKREFCDAMALCASLAVAPKVKRESFEQLWAQNSGKTWKALTDFPDRLRSLAKEVEQIYRSKLFTPELLVDNRVPSDNVQGLVRCFSEIPNALCYLANGIEAVAQELPAATSELYCRSTDHSRWIDELSELVNKLTGRPHDGRVAELLNAAEAVLHPNRRGKGFDAQTLADFRYRRRQKSLKT